MDISVCMIVRNEAETLARALVSIPNSFQKVVVDTGSTDQTIAIAKEYGAEVYFYKWNDHFADARNASLQYAQGDYILVMDADERLTVNVINQIESFINRAPDTAGSVIIRNISGDESTKHRTVRFMPNKDHYKFAGAVHEQVYDGGQPAIFEPSPIVIEHFGYDDQHYDLKKKFERYLKLYSEILAEQPKNGYMLYQLGKLYYSQKQYGLAYDSFAKCADLEEFDHTYFPAMLVQLGYSLKELGYSRAAKEFLETFVGYYSAYPDLPFLLGILCMECGEPQQMLHYFNSAAAIGETNVYSTVEGAGSYRAYYNLGLYYELEGRVDDALHYYELAAINDYKPAIERQQRIYKGI